MPEIDLDSFRAAYLANLQRTQDYMRACEAGLAALTAETYRSTPLRGRVVPSPDEQLDFDQAREYARFALARSYFRDVIDFVGHYIDHVFDKCLLIERIATKTIAPRQVSIQRILGAFRRKGLPEKLQILADTYEVGTPYAPHVLSINRTRNCLVHRLGRVGREDVLPEESGLTLRMLRFEVIRPSGARATGIWRETDIKKDQIRLAEVSKSFALRDHIRFDEQDLNDCAATMYALDDSIVRSLAEFSERLGIKVSRSTGRPRFEQRS